MLHHGDTLKYESVATRVSKFLVPAFDDKLRRQSTRTDVMEVIVPYSSVLADGKQDMFSFPPHHNSQRIEGALIHFHQFCFYKSTTRADRENQLHVAMLTCVDYTCCLNLFLSCFLKMYLCWSCAHQVASSSTSHARQEGSFCSVHK